MFASNPSATPDEGDAFFQALVALAPAGVYLTDPERKCVYVNRRWSEMAGLEPQEALGRDWIQAIHREDREAIAQRWFEAAHCDGEWKLEYRMQAPQGKTTWVLDLGKAIRDRCGQITGYLGINVDITERKTAEDELQACRERCSELLLAASAYRYSVKIQSGVPVSTEHGPGCAATTGYAPEDYSSHPSLWIDMVHPEDREQVRQHTERVMRNEAIPPLEHRILHVNGTVRWVRNTIVRHHDASGALVGYDGLIEDISERRRADERLRSVLESAAVAMILVDQEGRILFANAHTENVFGFKREELLQQPLEILLPERLRDIHVAARAEYSRAPSVRFMSDTLEIVGRRKDNSEFAAEIALSPIPTDEGLLVVAAVLDVTRRKKTEEALRLSLEIHATLAAMLRLSLDPLSLEEMLERALDLLLSLSWIRLEAKGAIFLVENDPQVLVMKAQRGLTEPLLTGCQRVPMGCCLCGLAAQHRQIVFAGCVDEHHVTRYSGMTPHGHYCVPIIVDHAPLGVINLYVQHGHERNPAEEGFLAAVAAVVAGIVKRKRGEEALTKSEERFMLAVRGTDAGIWDWDLLTDDVYFSPRWKSMLGYQDREIGNRYSEWKTRLHPEDRQRALTAVRDYLEGKTSEYELEHRLQHKDGSYRWILARGALVRDGSGRPYRMVGWHLDITDRKRSEQLIREREAELFAAQVIQEHFLPRSAPSVPGYDIAGSLLPAEFTAGDYYDYLVLPDGTLGIVVGDVCGHGFSAALVMASASAHLRSFALNHTDIGEILRHVNAVLCQETDDSCFVTLLFVQLELAARRLKYLNLGHPSGYVLGQSGDVKGVLQSSAVPLAILPEFDLPTGMPMELQPKDLILLTTDGFFEARSPEGAFFGLERMLDVVRAHRDRPASEIIQSLQQAVFDFTRLTTPQDDLTAVVIKVEP